MAGNFFEGGNFTSGVKSGEFGILKPGGRVETFIDTIKCEGHGKS